MPEALTAQIAEGKRALAAGEFENARQAFDTALKIDPGNQEATDWLGKVAAASGVVPTLADAENAEAAKDLPKAQTLFADVLKRNPGNAAATEGLARVKRAMADNQFNAEMGAGLAALNAGRLAEARTHLERAHQIRPDSSEVAAALQRVTDTGSGRSTAELAERAARLASEERWTEALAIYDEALARDPSLQFAQAGRAAVAPRAELGNRLQALIERPERLAADEVRVEAERLLARARALPDPGPGHPLAGVAPGTSAADIQSARHAGTGIRQRHRSRHPARRLLWSIRPARGYVETRQVHGHRQAQRLSRRAPRDHGVARPGRADHRHSLPRADLS